MLRVLLAIITLLFVTGFVIHNPGATSEPAASPADKAREDLSRIDYPSQRSIAWSPHFIRPEDSLEKLFGGDWPLVARFNRVDRRHVYPGMTIKVPDKMEQIRRYEPLPMTYEPARHYGKYILISLTEQWLGAYEYGKLKFSMPAATGSNDHKSPNGMFRVDAFDRHHTSSLYKTENQEEQYPMDYAIRFHVGEDNVSYWIHARDLPGRPASHGCIGVFDEAMQQRVYGIPEQPVLLDAPRLYEWVVGDRGKNEKNASCSSATDMIVAIGGMTEMPMADGDRSARVVGDVGDMEDVTYAQESIEPAFYGPPVEVIGDNPRYEGRSLFTTLVRR